MRLLWGAVVAVMLVTAGGDGRADEAPKRTLAKKHYELGSQYYETSDFANALVEFEKAYELQPEPGLLFNIARCHEVLAQLAPAIAHYERFLEAVPETPKRALVEARLETLRKRQAEQKREERAAPAPEPREPSATGSPAASSPAAQPASEPGAATAAPTPAWRTWAGWGAVGVGGAALVTGVVLGGMARDRSDAYTVRAASNDPHYGTLADLKSEGQALETGQIAALVSGGALVAAGLTLLLWDRLGAGQEQEAGPAVTVAPMAGPGGGGLACGGRF